jgi:hypothetical protein
MCWCTLSLRGISRRRDGSADLANGGAMAERASPFLYAWESSRGPLGERALPFVLSKGERLPFHSRAHENSIGIFRRARHLSDFVVD